MNTYVPFWLQVELLDPPCCFSAMDLEWWRWMTTPFLWGMQRGGPEVVRDEELEAYVGEPIQAMAERLSEV